MSTTAERRRVFRFKITYPTRSTELANTSERRDNEKLTQRHPSKWKTSKPSFYIWRIKSFMECRFLYTWKHQKIAVNFIACVFEPTISTLPRLKITWLCIVPPRIYSNFLLFEQTLSLEMVGLQTSTSQCDRSPLWLHNAVL